MHLFGYVSRSDLFEKSSLVSVIPITPTHNY